MLSIEDGCRRNLLFQQNRPVAAYHHQQQLFDTCLLRPATAGRERLHMAGVTKVRSPSQSPGRKAAVL